MSRDRVPRRVRLWAERAARFLSQLPPPIEMQQPDSRAKSGKRGLPSSIHRSAQRVKKPVHHRQSKYRD